MPPAGRAPLGGHPFALGDAIHPPDLAQALEPAQNLMQMVEVVDLDREARDGHAIALHAGRYRAHAGLELREYAHDVLEQLRTVLGFDLDLDRVQVFFFNVPLRLQYAIGGCVHVRNIRTIRSMRANAAADRHIPHDRIDRHRRATLG